MTDEKNKKNDEAEIKGLIDTLIKSLHHKNIESLMPIYAQDVVSFDVTAPLQVIGADAFKKRWEEAFLIFQDPINYEVRDLNITVGYNVAFSHSLNRLSGTMNNGQQFGPWVRWTACFRKINGKWLIAHHQASVPMDFAGKAVLDLKP